MLNGAKAAVSRGPQIGMVLDVGRYGPAELESREH
jgi:hypothetical protein